MKAFDMRFQYAALVTGFRSGLRGLFGVLVCCAALSAHAGAPAFITKSAPTIVRPTPNTAKVEYQPNAVGSANNRSFELPPVANDGVFVNDSIAVGIGGAVIEAVITRKVPPSAYPVIAAAMVGIGSYAITSSLLDYLNANDIQIDASGNPYRVIDGQTSTSYRFRAVYQGEINMGTLAAVEAAILSRVQAAYAAAPQYGQTSTTATGCTAQQTGVWECGFNTQTQNYQEYGPYNLYVQVVRYDDVWCMDSGGNLTVRPTGGACPGGTPDPVPPDNLPGLLPNPPPNAPGLVDDAVGAGVPVPASPPEVTGPATAPGPGGKTVTGPDGATVTNVVNNYHYEGDTITVTTTTTTTSPDGSTSTEQGEPKDDRTDCERNPESLGCLELGEVPDEEVEKVSRDVSVSGESVNLPSGCPADIQAGGQVFSFASACTFSQGVSPFVIAAAALMASLIVLRSIQGA